MKESETGTNIEKLFQLGQKYEFGESVEQSYKNAFEIYQKCAKAEYAPAYGKLGWFYLNGVTVKADNAKALSYFTKGADADDPAAMVNLGNMLEGSTAEIATKWYLKAALLGNRKAKFHYARCLYYGIGMKQDYGTAYWIFNQIAQDGERDVNFYKGLYYENGIIVDKSITLAVGFYERGARRGDEHCYASLGRLYAEGFDGIEPDYKKAAGFYLDSLSCNDASGYAEIANLYEKGVLSGAKDTKLAEDWRELATRYGGKGDSKKKIDEYMLRAKCLFEIGDELSLDDLKTGAKAVLKRDYCSYSWFSKTLHIGAYRTAAIFNQLERIGAVSSLDEEGVDRTFAIKMDLDEFEKIISSAESTDSANR